MRAAVVWCVNTAALQHWSVHCSSDSCWILSVTQYCIHLVSHLLEQPWVSAVRLCLSRTERFDDLMSWYFGGCKTHEWFVADSLKEQTQARNLTLLEKCCQNSNIFYAIRLSGDADNLKMLQYRSGLLVFGLMQKTACQCGFGWRLSVCCLLFRPTAVSPSGQQMGKYSRADLIWTLVLVQLDLVLTEREECSALPSLTVLML